VKKTAYSNRRCYVLVFAIANPSVCRLSVTFVRPTHGQLQQLQHFFTAVYPGHLLTHVQYFTEIIRGEALRRRRKTQEGSKIERW